jgi:amino acid transporter, AAT family
VGFIGEDSRPQLLSTFGLVVLLAVANWLNHRSGRLAGRVEAIDGDKHPLLVALAQINAWIPL